MNSYKDTSYLDLASGYAKHFGKELKAPLAKAAAIIPTLANPIGSAILGLPKRLEGLKEDLAVGLEDLEAESASKLTPEMAKNINLAPELISQLSGAPKAEVQAPSQLLSPMEREQGVNQLPVPFAPQAQPEQGVEPISQNQIALPRTSDTQTNYRYQEPTRPELNTQIANPRGVGGFAGLMGLRVHNIANAQAQLPTVMERNSRERVAKHDRLDERLALDNVKFDRTSAIAETEIAQRGRREDREIASAGADNALDLFKFGAKQDLAERRHTLNMAKANKPATYSEQLKDAEAETKFIGQFDIPEVGQKLLALTKQGHSLSKLQRIAEQEMGGINLEDLDEETLAQLLENIDTRAMQ